MKKFNIILFLFLFMSANIFAQTNNFSQGVSINATGAAPDASSILDVVASDKGMLIPRMITSDRTGIASPATGLLVYDITLKAICHYNGTAWQCLVTECETLDEAYDCGGAGAGASIAVDSGPVTLNGTAPGVSTLVVDANSTAANAVFNQAGPGSAITASQTNPAAVSTTASINNAGTGSTISASQTNAGAASTAVSVNTAGTGSAITATQTNAAATAATVNVSNAGNGSTIIASHTNAGSSATALMVVNQGVGSSISADNANASSTSPTVSVSNAGTGSALVVGQSNATAPTPATFISNAGTGFVLDVNQTNTTAGSAAVNVSNAGMGDGLVINTSDPANAANSASINHAGVGTGVRINTSNNMNPSNTLDVIQDGMGNAAFFNVSDNTNTLKSVDAHHQGQGIAGFFETHDIANMATTLESHQQGMGKAAHFESHNIAATTEAATATHQGLGDGFHGTATDPNNFTVAGVKGTGQGDRTNASALDIHDGQIRVTKTVSPNTPAEKLVIPLPSWLPMEDCPGTNPGLDLIAWNSDIITIPNVYCDMVRSVILLTTEHPIYGLNVQLIAVANGFFTVQFVYTVDSTMARCSPPSVCTLHYLIVNT